MSRPLWTRRVVPALALAFSVALVSAAPALASKPFRTVFGPPDPVVIPAGSGCAFDVLESVILDDHARGLYTEFADGRMVTHANGDATLTNMDSGASFLHRARFHDISTIVSADVVHSITTGSVFINFLPGDDGPLGEVSEPGAMIRFTGRVEYDYNVTTNSITDFAYSGTTIDICAALGQ